MSFWNGFISGASRSIVGGGLQGLQGIQGISGPIDELFASAKKTDDLVSSVVQPTISEQHAPVGTKECSSLNGRVYSRSGNDVCSQFISAPASFEHADATREEAGKQYQDGFNQVGEGVDKLVGDHHPWDSAKTIWGGLQDLDASADKYHDANREMMEAARNQIESNRGNSPDSMNMESHGSGGCVIV